MPDWQVLRVGPLVAVDIVEGTLHVIADPELSTKFLEPLVLL